MTEFDCISLNEPWASLCLTLNPTTRLPYKRHETRSWTTKKRGLLLIHASKKWNPSLRDLCRKEPFFSVLIKLYRGPWAKLFDDTRGCIIGGAYLTDIKSTNEFKPADELDLAFGDYSPNRYAWVLERPFKFLAPVPQRGALGIFRVSSAEILAAIGNVGIA